MAGTHNHGTRAPAWITQGLSALQVITELLKRFRIELLDAQPVLLCPLREAVYATNRFPAVMEKYLALRNYALLYNGL
jgi:hypothetical protein